MENITNEQAKQEVIIKEFKKAGYAFLLPLNVNGWIKVKPDQYDSPLFERLKINSKIHSIRPKSLKNLDTNNGWIRIEPDGSNLPEKRSAVDMWKVIQNNEVTEYNTNGVIHHFKRGSVTHYKPITPELKPIY